MKKFMIFVLCMLISMSFGYASIFAGPGCTIGATNCIVGETGPELTLSETDPAGQKKVNNYDGPYDIGIYELSFVPNPTLGMVVDNENVILYTNSLFNNKTDYCSALGDNYYEVSIDKKGKYLRTVDTSSFVFMHEQDYFDYENDVYYEYYGTGLHKAYEIYSNCKEFEAIQAVDTYTDEYIYIWDATTAMQTNKIFYIPMSVFYENINVLYDLLKAEEKDKADVFFSFAFGSVSLTEVGDFITSMKAAKKVGEMMPALTPAQVIAILSTLMIVQDLMADNVLNNEITKVDDLIHNPGYFDEKTAYKISHQQTHAMGTVGLRYFKSQIVFDKENVSLLDDSYYTSDTYGKLERREASLENIISIYDEIIPISIIDSTLGELFDYIASLLS